MHLAAIAPRAGRLATPSPVRATVSPSTSSSSSPSSLSSPSLLAAAPRCAAPVPLAAARPLLLPSRSAPAAPRQLAGWSVDSIMTLHRMRPSAPLPSLSLHARHFASSGETLVVNVPSMGDSITEGVLEKWYVSVGQQVAVDDLVAGIETDKVTQEIRAPVAGAVTVLSSKPGDTVAVGKPLFAIEVGATGSSSAGATAAAAPAPAAAAPKVETNAPAPVGKPAASTAARPAAPKAEAPAPVRAAAPAAPAPTAAAAAAAPASSAAAAPGARNERRVPMSRMRLTIAKNMKESQNTAASLTTFQECDMHNLMQLRDRYKDVFFERHGVKLGFMSAFVKAAAAALQEIPAVNASLDGNDIVYHDYADICVAVATPKGLVVPAIRNAQSLSFADVEKTIADMGARARAGQLALSEMQGGTFTISNGGVFGSMMGTPILNPPQSAILGMHAINKRPVVVGDQIVIRPMMYLALTYDHRIIDGREAATFLVKIKAFIEDPSRLLLDV